MLQETQRRIGRSSMAAILAILVALTTFASCASQRTVEPSKIIDDRNSKIFNAKLGLKAPAGDFVASLDSVRGIAQAFNAEMDTYRSYDHARIAATTGQTEVIPTPQYPTASMVSATNSARASRQSFKMALDRYEIDVKMIMSSFYEDFADLIGHEEASKVPPPPVTSMDSILDQAIQLERDFDRALQTAIRGG